MTGNRGIVKNGKNERGGIEEARLRLEVGPEQRGSRNNPHQALAKPVGYGTAFDNFLIRGRTLLTLVVDTAKRGPAGFHRTDKVR